ncbi:Glycoside hydrolase, family 5 [Pseudohyphozyma bogoriensis]|nr:Glycoside hydrolase, family 5 [Pseudohyphozyma bogoriensis]
MAADHSTEFVTRKGSSLYLGGQPFRFASMNCPELLDGDVNQQFEVEDTMKTFASWGRVPVVRTYCLRINSQRIGRGHIKGWNREWGDWEWDGDRLKELDFVLDSASRHGVRLIIPLINQDFGGDTNWVGNTTDLVRYRKGVSHGEAKNVDFWRDEEMINSVKLIIDKLLTRKNSINGRIYGQDPVILAWETGNEFMEGSYPKTEDVASCYHSEVLEAPEVDIFSYHYYGAGETHRLKEDCRIAAKHDKIFIAGEYGFYDKIGDYNDFLSAIDSAGGAGSLVWSFRPHSSAGGFKTHGEDGGHWSYHVPGWNEPLHGEFDPRDVDIVTAIRKAAFKINKDSVPPPPTPQPPERLWLTSPTTLCWTGSAWAASYELIVRHRQNGREFGRRTIVDCTKEGTLHVDLSVELGLAEREQLSITMRALSVNGNGGSESSEVIL